MRINKEDKYIDQNHDYITKKVFEYDKMRNRFIKAMIVIAIFLVISITLGVKVVQYNTYTESLEKEKRDMKRQIYLLESTVDNVNGKYNEVSSRCNELIEENNEYAYQNSILIFENEELMKKVDELEMTILNTQVAIKPDYNIKPEELEILYKCVQAEAGETAYDSQKLVTQVIINRVKSAGFPNTIKEVIYQKGQFSVATNGMLDKQVVTYETYKSVTEALLFGTDAPSDVLYFYSDKYVKQDHWIRTLPIYKKVQGTIFAFPEK